VPHSSDETEALSKKVKKLNDTDLHVCISELRDVTCHMGSHSVTCYPTQANIPHFNHSQTVRYL